jgi:hypothetical protein
MRSRGRASPPGRGQPQPLETNVVLLADMIAHVPGDGIEADPRPQDDARRMLALVSQRGARGGEAGVKVHGLLRPGDQRHETRIAVIGSRRRARAKAIAAQRIEPGTGLNEGLGGPVSGLDVFGHARRRRRADRHGDADLGEALHEQPIPFRAAAAGRGVEQRRECTPRRRGGRPRSGPGRWGSGLWRP